LTTIIHTIYIRPHFFVLVQNIFIKFIQLLFTAYRLCFSSSDGRRQGGIIIWKVEKISIIIFRTIWNDYNQELWLLI